MAESRGGPPGFLAGVSRVLHRDFKLFLPVTFSLNAERMVL